MKIEIPSEYDPNRALIIAMLHNAISAYFYPDSLTHSGKPTPEKKAKDRKRYHALAKAFIFDDDYLLDWADTPISPSKLLDKVDLDLHEVRKMILFKEEQGINDNRHQPLLGERYDG